MQTLIQANSDALRQAGDLLDGMTDAFYQRKKLGTASGVGAHIRHIVDHYRALQSGLDSDLVDYDSRRRNCAAETNRQLAQAEIARLTDWLQNELCRDDEHCLIRNADESIEISSEVCFQSSKSMVIASTPRRELCYLLNHTVHHVAYVSLLVKQAGFRISETIGVAPATLNGHGSAVAASNRR